MIVYFTVCKTIPVFPLFVTAGILSHLCSSEEWQVEDSVPRQNVLSELEKRVLGWDNPTGEMVAYRYFFLFLCARPTGFAVANS